MQLRHVGINVRDLPRAIDFYRQFGFGFLSWSNEHTEKGKIYTAKVDKNIELIQGRWMNHFALTVDRLDDFNLPDRPIFSKETDKVKVCYITDPSGNVIELVEDKK